MSLVFDRLFFENYDTVLSILQASDAVWNDRMLKFVDLKEVFIIIQVFFHGIVKKRRKWHSNSRLLFEADFGWGT